MAFIRQIAEADATGPLKRVYAAATGREGSVAGIVKVMGLDAPSLQASMQVYMSLMKRDNALMPSQREMLAAVVSNVNDCYY